jgi:hypothetical protein
MVQEQPLGPLEEAIITAQNVYQQDLDESPMEDVTADAVSP